MKKIVPALLVVTAALGALAYKNRKKIQEEVKVLIKVEKEPKKESKEEEEIDSPITNPLDEEKSLRIQAELALDNYKDVEYIMLSHHMIYFDNELLFEMVKHLKKQGYQLVDTDEVISLERKYNNIPEEIIESIVEVASIVSKDKGIYKGFEIKPVVE